MHQCFQVVSADDRLRIWNEYSALTKQQQDAKLLSLIAIHMKEGANMVSPSIASANPCGGEASLPLMALAHTHAFAAAATSAAASFLPSSQTIVRLETKDYTPSMQATEYEFDHYDTR